MHRIAGILAPDSERDAQAKIVIMSHQHADQLLPSALATDLIRTLEEL